MQYISIRAQRRTRIIHGMFMCSMLARRPFGPFSTRPDDHRRNEKIYSKLSNLFSLFTSDIYRKLSSSACHLDTRIFQLQRQIGIDQSVCVCVCLFDVWEMM